MLTGPQVKPVSEPSSPAPIRHVVGVLPAQSKRANFAASVTLHPCDYVVINATQITPQLSCHLKGTQNRNEEQAIDHKLSLR